MLQKGPRSLESSKKRQELIILDNGENRGELSSVTFSNNLSSLYEAHPKFDEPPIQEDKSRNLWQCLSKNILTPFAPKHSIYNYKKFIEHPRTSKRKTTIRKPSSSSESSDNIENSKVKSVKQSAPIKHPEGEQDQWTVFANEKLKLSRKRIFELMANKSNMSNSELSVYSQCLKMLSEKRERKLNEHNLRNPNCRRPAQILEETITVEAPGILRKRPIDSIISEDPDFLAEERSNNYAILSEATKKETHLSTNKLLYIIPNHSKEVKHETLKIDKDMEEMLSLKKPGEKRRCNSFNFNIYGVSTYHQIYKEEEFKQFLDRNKDLLDLKKEKSDEILKSKSHAFMFEGLEKSNTEYDINLEELINSGLQDHTNTENQALESENAHFINKLKPKLRTLFILKSSSVNRPKQEMTSSIKNPKDYERDIRKKLTTFYEGDRKSRDRIKKIALYEVIRRKSCYCRKCGGAPKKYKKTWNFVSDIEKDQIRENLYKLTRVKHEPKPERRLICFKDGDPERTSARRFQKLLKDCSPKQASNFAEGDNRKNLKRYLSFMETNQKNKINFQNIKAIATTSGKKREEKMLDLSRSRLFLASRQKTEENDKITEFNADVSSIVQKYSRKIKFITMMKSPPDDSGHLSNRSPPQNNNKTLDMNKRSSFIKPGGNDVSRIYFEGKLPFKGKMSSQSPINSRIEVASNDKSLTNEFSYYFKKKTSAVIRKSREEEKSNANSYSTLPSLIKTPDKIRRKIYL